MRQWRRALCVAYTSVEAGVERDFYEDWIRSIDSKDGPEICFPNFGTGKVYFPRVTQMGLDDWRWAWKICNP